MLSARARRHAHTTQFLGEQLEVGLSFGAELTICVQPRLLLKKVRSESIEVIRRHIGFAADASKNIDSERGHLATIFWWLPHPAQPRTPLLKGQAMVVDYSCLVHSERPDELLVRLKLPFRWLPYALNVDPGEEGEVKEVPVGHRRRATLSRDSTVHKQARPKHKAHMIATSRWRVQLEFPQLGNILKIDFRLVKSGGF